MIDDAVQDVAGRRRPSAPEVDLEDDDDGGADHQPSNDDHDDDDDDDEDDHNDDLRVDLESSSNSSNSSSFSGGMDDDEADQFTTVSDIAYGVLASPRIMVAYDDDDDNNDNNDNEGGVASSRDRHGHCRCAGEERRRRRRRQQQRRQHRGHHHRWPVGAVLVSPSTGTAGDDASSTVDGIGSGSGWGGMKSSYDSYYDMQRDGPYISGTNIRQDMMIRNVESWNMGDNNINNNNNNRNIVDLDDVDDDDLRQRRRMFPSNDVDEFCDLAECGHVKERSWDYGDNSTLSSLTRDACFSPMTGKFGRGGGGRMMMPSSSSSPSSSPWYYSASSRMQQLQPRHMSSPPTTPKKRGKMAGGGGLARPAILSERIATGGHVPLDDSDVVVSSSRPPAEVILINAATANALAKVPHELPFSCDQDGTHSVSHEFTPSSIDNTSGGGVVVVLLDPWRILVHKKVPPVESSPRRSRRRLVALSLLVLLLVGIAVGIALAYGGGGDGVHAMKGHDVVMWGDVPGTQDACCVIVDVARPGEDGGEEDEGSDGGGEDVPPIADASLAVLPPSNGGYDDHDPDPIVPASAPVATSGGGSTAKDPTASPTRGPTREESTSSGGGATASPTAVRRPAPSPSPDRGEDHASVARPSASPTTTSPTAGMPVAASSPSASPTANDTPTTTTYPTTEMPVTASPTTSSSASWAPVAVTAEPTPRSPSASPTDATWAPVAVTAEPTTRSPSASPTDAPVTGSPTISPSETPTTFVAPEPTPYPMIIFSNCPDEATDDTKYQKGVMVSYRSDDPMWKVYECLVGACNAAGLSTEKTWALRGLCKPSNDQIKGDSEDDAPEPTTSPIEPPYPEDRYLPDEEVVFRK